MKVSIIGYRNHSIRLKNILESIGVHSTLWNYHIDDFSALVTSDCILISSPNDTHVDYIKRIVTESPSSYIFCEKPPAATFDELDYLRNLDENIKKKLFFNFNYRFSFLADLIKKEDLGKPVHFNFVSSHGLALKDYYKDNWRFSSENALMGVYGTVAIHYIDLCLWLLGEYEYINVNKSNYSGSKLDDSVTIDMKFKNGCTVNIFVSYVTPFINQSQLIFDNAIVQLDDGVVSLYKNRETFDEFGNFMKPKEQIVLSEKSSKDYYNLSIKKSLDNFINYVKEKKPFSIDDFNRSIESNTILLTPNFAKL